MPSGFRDYGPRDAIARQKMIEKIRTTFERFGFDPMETPAVERTEVLTGGEATAGKIIFGVRGSEEKEEDPDGRASKSLRFDLTVPLARFLAANPDIPKPFKRYQIGNVWRGERAKAGRYREFMQADIDIVGAKSSEADAEIIAVMYEALSALGAGDMEIRLNSRETAFQMLDTRDVPRERQLKTLIEVDKREKLPKEKWWGLISDTSGMDRDTTATYITELEGECPALVEKLREAIVRCGVPESTLRYDGTTVRGLAYYTGMIFEITLRDAPEVGSVVAGGRYDGLSARFSPLDLPAVGASIGVDRLFAALEKLGKIQKKETNAQVLILNLIEGEGEYVKIAQELRSAGIATVVYLGDDRAFQAQLAYAVKKEIPYVVIYGEEEERKGVVQIKNLATREQTEVAREKIVEYFAK